MKLENGMQLKVSGSDIKVIVTASDYTDMLKVGETTYLDRNETPGVIEIVDSKKGIFRYINTKCVDVYYSNVEQRFLIRGNVHGEFLYKLDTEDRFPFPQSIEACFTSI